MCSSDLVHPASPPAALQEDAGAEGTSESPDGMDSALLDAGTQPWAYAGLLIGMAAIRAMDINEQRTLRPSGTLQEANGPRDEAKKNESQHQ